MRVDKRHATHPDQVVGLSTERLRAYYLANRLFEADTISLVHNHVERMVIGGALPGASPLTLDACPDLATGPFLAMRELGIINIGGPGRVDVDGTRYDLAPRDGLYVPMGTKSLQFESLDPAHRARYYLVSTPAHARYETVKITIADARPMPMGSPSTSNERVIYKYVDPEVCRSAQLLLGLTMLKEGSVWNTMPCHRHERRSETYFYFDMKPEARVFHFMGEPDETRHLVVANEEAVMSPPWSIHTGCGTSNYSFIWAMGGENIDYRDMAGVPMEALR